MELDKYKEALNLLLNYASGYVEEGHAYDSDLVDVDNAYKELQELIDKYSKDSCEHHCQIVDDIREQWKANEQKNIELEKVLDKGYEVHGLMRRHSIAGTDRIDHIMNSSYNGVKFFMHFVDTTDSSCLCRLISEIKPTEVYNLAAQSFVATSWEQPLLTANIDALGVTNMLEAIDDVMVKAGLLADDNYTIIQSHDGSRVLYDKENPRTIIEIEKKEI